MLNYTSSLPRPTERRQRDGDLLLLRNVWGALCCRKKAVGAGSSLSLPEAALWSQALPYSTLQSMSGNPQMIRDLVFQMQTLAMLTTLIFSHTLRPPSLSSDPFVSAKELLTSALSPALESFPAYVTDTCSFCLVEYLVLASPVGSWHAAAGH